MSALFLRATAKESYGRMGRLLFSPFSPSKWLRLALIAFLAGSLGSGGCSIQSFGNNTEKESSYSAALSAAEPAENIASHEGALQSARNEERSRYGFVDGIFRPGPAQTPSVSGLWLSAVLIPLAILLILALLAFWIFVIWIGVRFKFMWYRAVRDDDAGVRRLYAQCKSPAEDLFDFWLGFSAIEMLAYAGMASWLIWTVISVSGGWGQRIEWAPVMAFNVLWAPLSALAVLWIFFSIVRLIGNDFLVPLAARYPGERRVWSRWVDLYSRHRSGVWRYLLFRFLLSILWGAAQVIALLIYVGIWVLAAILAASIGALAAQAWPFLKTLLLIVAIAAGVPLLAVFLAGLGCVFLPGSVFARDFSARVLDRLEPESP